jgi:NADP-dependent 3-hydroxy acid dehydrogenase YdfG
MPQSLLDVNIKGVLYGIAAVLPYMKQQKAGHIINVSSVAGHKVAPGGTVYSATKHAVRVISDGLRQEVKPYNLRTTVISPGAVATELPNSITDPDVAERIRNVYAIAVPADSFARAMARRYEPTRRRGRERDPLPAHTPGILS